MPSDNSGLHKSTRLDIFMANMSDKPKTAKPDLKITDVAIFDIAAVPAKYFAHDEVIEAVRRVVRSDVVVHGAAVPAGVKPVFGKAIFNHEELKAAFNARNRRATVAWSLIYLLITLIIGGLLVWMSRT